MTILEHQLIGRKYGHITLLSLVKKNNKHQWWLCRCDCGNTKTIRLDSVKNGRSVTCGCIKIIHNLTNTSTYSTWEGMIQRCTNPNSISYKNYGGRGITVCERWLKFENFYKDMGNKPDGLTLDRINNNGHYEPSNCKWSTWSEQVLNKRKRIS